IVDVAGAVRRPGVYRFEQGARVIDAISRAGGTTGKALVGAINRAATLSDGQQVVVPSAGSPGSSGLAAAGSGAVGSAPETPVSLGTATQEQLEEIDGIGPVTAEKILEFRDSQGGLGSIEELDQVSGIGPVTMESLRAALAP
ncbi:MAG: helix-hairpin-helix domain-containing protein, partial [Solirubrobacterales bacterium]|nr:helix-hairpin-helix domain-containing protein [Solirubrobacterales bacterium]